MMKPAANKKKKTKRKLN